MSDATQLLSATVNDALAALHGGPALGLCPALVETHHPDFPFRPGKFWLKLFSDPSRDFLRNLARQV